MIKRRSLLGVTLGGVSLPFVSGRLYGTPGSLREHALLDGAQNDLLTLALHGTTLPEDQHQLVLPFLQLVSHTLAAKPHGHALLVSPVRYLSERGIPADYLPVGSAEVRLVEALTTDDKLQTLADSHDFLGLLTEMNNRGIFDRSVVSGLEQALRQHLLENFEHYNALLRDAQGSLADLDGATLMSDPPGSGAFIVNVSVVINVMAAVNVAVVVAVALAVAVLVTVEVSVDGCDEPEADPCGDSALSGRVGSKHSPLLNLVDLHPEYKEQMSRAAHVALLLGNREFSRKLSQMLFEDLATGWIDAIAEVFDPNWSEAEIAFAKRLIIEELGRTAGVH